MVRLRAVDRVPSIARESLVTNCATGHANEVEQIGNF